MTTHSMAIPAPTRRPGERGALFPGYDRIMDRAHECLSRKLFFVAGCQKSGTTWVERLLNGHPEMICRGEARFTDMLLHPLAKTTEMYSLEQKVGPQGQFSRDQFLALYANAIGMILSNWIGDESAPPLIGEKTPQNALALHYLGEVFPTARFIHIIRDGRDGAVSGWFHNLSKDNPAFRETFPTFADYVRYFARTHWVRYIETARKFGRADPDRYLEVRYEELHADQRAVTRVMLEFLAADASDESVDSCLQAGAFERLSGGRQRGQEDSRSHFRKGVIGDWRDHFDDAAIAAYMEVAGPLASELGYI
ncbi:MAG: sulfotransferase family protein [Phycisphaerales bacterium]